MMEKYCALCETEFKIPDGGEENKLSDGGVLCNNCLERVSNINEYIPYQLEWYSLSHIQETIKYNLRSKSSEEEEVPIVKEEEKPIEDIPAEPTKDDLIFKDYKKNKETFKQQIEESGAKLSMTMRGELKQLPHVLDDDERIVAATECKIGDTGEGLLVVTQKRMLHVEKFILSKASFKEVLNEDIKSVTWNVSQSISVLSVSTNKGAVPFFFQPYQITEGSAFYAKIGIIYNKPKPKPQPKLDFNPNPLKKDNSQQIFGWLERLNVLYERGILTEEEFSKQKAKFLNEI
ncbi:SHOCT domain-containing protein [Chryseobacterium sp. MMS23-Vi53]|uniref:SHOCT domain-containing protein n=1 Tax=Chryseobacterium sp. MMS23-Vi53 TaxID=3386644 RepID=UPI0039EBBB95